jgi:hypothetical protein
VRARGTREKSPRITRRSLAAATKQKPPPRHEDTKTQKLFEKSKASPSASRFSLCLGVLVVKNRRTFPAKKQEFTDLSHEFQEIGGV